MRFLILKHVAHEGPGLIQTYLDQNRHIYQIVELEHGEHIPPVEEFDVVVAMGGPMNVYQEEEYPFLKEENALIRQVLREKKPFLGVCLGAQLLAKAAGAQVHENLWKEIGNLPVTLTEAGEKDPLFNDFPKEFHVFQWHGDTFEIPEGGINLAGSELCKHQALRVGEKAYGLQFHLEVTAPMVEEWFVLNEQEVYEEQLDAALIMDQFKERESSYQALAYRLLDNFLELIRE